MKKIANVQAAKECVREFADLFQVISEDVGSNYIWEEEGTHTYVTNSPFREETKPSFKVSGKKFKDWGGEQHSGDIFTWIQLWHGLNFYESIVYIATRLNIDITRFLRDPTKEEIQKSNYKLINKIAAEWMHQCLLDNPPIRDEYLSQSGFTIEMITPYLVGYCPSKDALINHISSKYRLTDDDVSRLDFYRSDLFNHAIVYPVHDHSGDVAIFYTRQIGVQDAPYKSTKTDHPLHDPGIFYGFHVAKKKFRANGLHLDIVEGFRDAIALGAAAVRSSSCSPQQIESLKKHNIRSINICFDGDQTGWRNSLDVINNLDQYGDILVLISRPNDVDQKFIDKDPHVVWKIGGEGAVHEMLSKARTPLEFYVTTLYDVNNLTTTDTEKLLRSLKDFLVKSSGVHLEIGANYLSKILHISKESIADYASELKVQHSELHNLEAERTAIACCMKYPASINTLVATGAMKETFTLSYYQKLFEACKVCYREYNANYTPQAVLDKAMNIYADIRLPEIVTLVLEDNLKFNEETAFKIILDMWRRRIASEQASKLINSSRDLSKDFVEMINEHRRNLINTSSSTRPRLITPQEGMERTFALIKERQLADKGPIIGVPIVNMPNTNVALGGIQKGHMTVLAADTGVGKSAVGMNWAACIIKAGIPMLWIAHEMSIEVNDMRLLSIMSGVSNTKIQIGRLNQEEADKLADTRKIIDASAFHMAKPAYGTEEEILALIDEARFKYGIEYVFWDYIQMVVASQSQYRMSREQIIGSASKTIKTKVTEDMGLGAIMIAQLNRDTQAKDGKHRIAGSFQIVQDADNLVEVVEKTKKQIAEDGELNGNRYIRIPKRRSGPSNYSFNAYLDIDKAETATLRMSEFVTPEKQAQFISSVAI